jgi:hypothetical protein
MFSTPRMFRGTKLSNITSLSQATEFRTVPHCKTLVNSKFYEIIPSLISGVGSEQDLSFIFLNIGSIGRGAFPAHCSSNRITYKWKRSPCCDALSPWNELIIKERPKVSGLRWREYWGAFQPVSSHTRTQINIKA